MTQQTISQEAGKNHTVNFFFGSMKITITKGDIAVWDKFYKNCKQHKTRPELCRIVLKVDLPEWLIFAKKNNVDLNNAWKVWLGGSENSASPVNGKRIYSSDESLFVKKIIP